VERLKNRLMTAQKALGTLKELLTDEKPSMIVRDAAIQRFEYSFEALWKTGSRFLRSYEGIDTGSPKGTIRGFFQTGYLTDAQTKCGLEMVDDRNLTSHTYNEALSERIFQKLPEYAALMDSWLSSMSEKLK
jgi:nucleotidyltransferase substrate binding protein (TIGR01987 family)